MTSELLKAANNLAKKINNAESIIHNLNENIQKDTDWSLNLTIDESKEVLPLFQKRLDRLRAEFAAMGER